jgi:hypothetical protein
MALSRKENGMRSTLRILLLTLFLALPAFAQAGPGALKKAAGKVKGSLGMTSRLGKLAAKIMTARRAITSLENDLRTAGWASERFRLQLQVLRKKTALQEALAERALRGRFTGPLTPRLKKKLMTRKLAIRRAAAAARLELVARYLKALGPEAGRSEPTLEMLEARAELSRLTQELKLLRRTGIRLHSREYQRKQLAIEIRTARQEIVAIRAKMTASQSAGDRLEYQVKLSELKDALRLARNRHTYLSRRGI